MAVLAIKRKQIPLAPALALTAHAAQGQTKEAVIADLVIGRGVSSISSYVAITRIKNREGLMIYRPFDREPFTGGVPQGTALLLSKLQGEELDWVMIEENMILKKTCAVCQKRGDRSKFTQSEFRQTQAAPVCIQCMEDCKGELDDWTHHFCVSCTTIKPENKFKTTERQREFFRKSHCKDCHIEQRGGKQTEQPKKNLLLCSGCKENFQYNPAGHITEEQRKHHLR